MVVRGVVNLKGEVEAVIEDLRGDTEDFAVFRQQKGLVKSDENEN